eukprot:8248032-Prorocentrum_lima.AAC.1
MQQYLEALTVDDPSLQALFARVLGDWDWQHRARGDGLEAKVLQELTDIIQPLQHTTDYLLPLQAT